MPAISLISTNQFEAFILRYRILDILRHPDGANAAI
jgi:hypothetical protein